MKITVVDENDNVIGAEDPKIVAEKGLIHRIVRVIVKNSKGKYYLQFRGPNKTTFPNRWDQSVGGHVDEGETYEEAALREMEEELGIKDVKLTKLTKFYHDNEADLNLKRFNMLYEALYDGEIKIEEGESTDGGWHEEEEIKNWMKQKPQDFTPGCIETFERYWKIKSKK